MEYLYKFVTRDRFAPADRNQNRDLLDHGTLYVAKFHADGRLTWLPLIWGQGPLSPANGFSSAADVLIETRRAAELLGATPMDRPEDVEANPTTGLVYAVMTNNSKRETATTDAANPRGPNPHGHILEIAPPGNTANDRDHAALEFTWRPFILAGNPRNPADQASYHAAVSDNGWLTCPDNIAFDPQGRMWIATDGAPKFGFADGAFACETVGPNRALTKQFYRTPIGAELCGPEFNPDGTAFFAAVQHPGDTEGSTFDAPATRWPDFQPGMPPRPSLQVIVKNGGGAVGS
jgi:secreted PhoX family phosphatase